MDHDPFAQPAFKLVPVEGDPFASAPSGPPGTGAAGPLADIGAKAAETPAAPSQSWEDWITAPLKDPARDIQLGLQDVGRGVANAAGAPFDLVNMALNVPIAAVDKGLRLFGGGGVDFRLPTNAGGTIADTYVEAAKKLGAPAPVPWGERTGQEKLAGNVIDFATQGAASGAGLARAAATRFADAAPEIVPNITDRLLRPYIKDPARTIVGDAAAGAGTGAAVNAADSYAPDHPFVKFLAALAGGAGGGAAASLVTAPKAALETALGYLPSSIKPDPLTNMPVSRRVAEHAARFVQEKATDAPAAAATLNERVRQAEIHGEPVPTSGIGSNDIGLVALERALRNKNSVPFQVKDQALQDAASGRLSDMRDPTADQSAVNRRAEAVRQERMAPVIAAEQGAQSLADAFAADRQAEGATLAVRRGSDRQAEASRALDTAVVDQTYLPARAQKNELYRAIDPAGTEMRDSAPLAAAVERIRQREAALPPSMRTDSPILRDIEALVDPATGQARPIAYRDLDTMRMKLSTAARQAREGGSPDFDLADAYDRVRAAIGGEAQRMAAEGSPAGERAQAAITNFRENFAPLYRAGPGDEMTTFTRRIDQDPTRSTTPPTATGARFLSAPEKAAALQRVLATSPSRASGEAAARDYLLNDYASSVLNDNGTVNAIRASKWAENNAAVLDQLPGLRQEVDSMVANARRGADADTAAAARLRQARERRTATEQEIDRGAIGTLLNEDPRNVASSIFGNRYGTEKQLEQINRLIGADEQARRGWRAAVVDVLSDKVRGTNTAIGGPEGPVLIAQLQKVFKLHENELAKVFSPTEMNTLRRVHKMLEPLGNLSRQAVAGSPTTESQNLVNGLETAILTYTGNAITTGMIMRRLKAVAALLPGVREMTLNAKMARVIERMALDPRLAAHLLTRDVKELRGPRWNGTLNRLLGVNAAVAGPDDASANTAD